MKYQSEVNERGKENQEPSEQIISCVADGYTIIIHEFIKHISHMINSKSRNMYLSWESFRKI